MFSMNVNQCTGCYACVIACMDQNDIDGEQGEVSFRKIITTESADGQISYNSVSCVHCQEPSCIKVCPNHCFYQDGELGLVLYDQKQCIGCQRCGKACAMGAISFDQHGKIAKCNGCSQRRKEGMVPACMRVCPVGAITYK